MPFDNDLQWDDDGDSLGGKTQFQEVSPPRANVSSQKLKECDRCPNLERALKHAQTRAVAAVRQAAKLKVELDARYEEDAAFKAKLQNIETRELAKQSETTDVRDKLREAEYKISCLNKELQRKSEALRTSKYRANARLERFAESLEATEQAALERGEKLQEATRAIQKTVIDLRRHLGAGGFHAVNSHTAKRLMSKICDASNKLGRAALLPGQEDAKAAGLLIDGGNEAKNRCSDDDEFSPVFNRSKKRQGFYGKQFDENGEDFDLDGEDSDDEDAVDRALLKDSLLGGECFISKGENSLKSNSTSNLVAGGRRGRISAVKSKASQAALLLAATDGTLAERGYAAELSSSSETRKLVRDLCSLCQDLERRNGQLTSKLESAQLELDAAAAKSSSANLVSKYRVAIVRAKAQVHSMHEKMLRQNEQLTSMEEQVRSQKEHIEELARQRDNDRLRRQQAETKASRMEQETARLLAKLNDLELGAQRRRQFLESMHRERGVYTSETAPSSAVREEVNVTKRELGDDFLTIDRPFTAPRTSYSQSLDEFNFGTMGNIDGLDQAYTPDIQTHSRPVTGTELNFGDAQFKHTPLNLGYEDDIRIFGVPPSTGGQDARGDGILDDAFAFNEPVDSELASTLRANLDSLHQEIASLQRSMA